MVKATLISDIETKIEDELCVGDSIECKKSSSLILKYYDEQNKLLKSYTILQGKTHTIKEENCKKDAYQIKWKVTNVITSNKDTTVQLQCKYELKEYQITYYNVDNAKHDNPVTYQKQEQNILLKEPIRVGYCFKGWYTQKDFTGEPITSIEAGTAKDISLYAKWEEKEITVSFVTNEEMTAIPNLTKKYTQEISYPNPEKEGYRFSGWYQDKEFTKICNTDFRPQQDTSIYAKWDKIYAITVSQEENGSIAVNKQEAIEKELVQITVTPDSGYKLLEDSLKINGEKISLNQDNTFLMPARDSILSAEFVRTSFYNNGIVVKEKDGTHFSKEAVLTVSRINLEEKQLQQLNKQIILLEANSEIIKLLDIAMLAKNEKISSFPNGIILKIKVQALENNEGLKVIFIGEDNKVQLIEAIEEDGYLKLETNQLGYFGIIAKKQETQMSKPIEVEETNIDGNEQEKNEVQEPIQEDKEEYHFLRKPETGDIATQKIVQTGDMTIILATSAICIILLINLLQIKMTNKKKKENK